jgi:hypothetical protein
MHWATMDERKMKPWRVWHIGDRVHIKVDGKNYAEGECTHLPKQFDAVYEGLSYQSKLLNQESLPAPRFIAVGKNPDLMLYSILFSTSEITLERDGTLSVAPQPDTIGHHIKMYLKEEEVEFNKRKQLLQEVGLA